MAIINIAINLIVEIPLLWWLGEPAMAVGTLVSFAIQAVVMLWMLDRRLGGLDLKTLITPSLKMIAAAIAMTLALYAIKLSPLYPTGSGRLIWSMQLSLLLLIGAGVYLAVSYAMGLETFRQLLPKRR
jgi:putative peptidoglycan lipid II flippase